VEGKKMTRENIIMANIEKLGDKYCWKYLNYWNKEELTNNWWTALKFFFSHSFMRGRRDKLSNEYYYFTLAALKDCFAIDEDQPESSYQKLLGQRDEFNSECILDFKHSRRIGKGNSIKHNDFKKEIADKNQIISSLIAHKEVEVGWDDKIYKKRISLGNDADLMMVLDVLCFITLDLARKNIYNYIKDSMEKNGLTGIYKELRAIRSIGDKIASFTLRDMLLLNPELRMFPEDYEKAFPVDTWVIRIAYKLDCRSERSEEIKKYFIKRCSEFGVNPFKFNAGIWFLGFHSLDILLENCLGGKIIE